MVVLKNFFNNIHERDGIYYCDDDLPQEELSYPEEGYDYLLNLEVKSFWYKHRNRIIRTLIDRYSPNEILFDIGGGSGAVSSYLDKNGYQSVVIEPGHKGALNAFGRGLDTVCSTFESLSLQDRNLIKSVGLFDVIEHIEDDVTFLEQLKNFVADQGLVYITVPAYNFLWSNDDVAAGHFRRYSILELIKKLNILNYEVLYSSYLFSPLVLPIFFFRSLSSRMGLRAVEFQKEFDEHSGDGLLAKMIQPILGFEEMVVREGVGVPIGTSCTIVARNFAS